MCRGEVRAAAISSTASCSEERLTEEEKEVLIHSLVSQCQRTFDGDSGSRKFSLLFFIISYLTSNHCLKQRLQIQMCVLREGGHQDPPANATAYLTQCKLRG